MTIQYYLFFISILSGCINIFGQPMPLNEGIRLSLENNVEIQNDKLDVQFIDHQIQEAQRENQAESTIGLVDKALHDLSTEVYIIKIRHMLGSQYAGLEVNTSVIGITTSEDPIQIILNNKDRIKEKGSALWKRASGTSSQKRALLT